jgi:NADH:ubiquinone reductase (H+-translocating)
MDQPVQRGDRTRVVVVGGGFGGLSLVKELASAEADIILVDRQNHQVFQPLLYQVATAALSPAEIAEPTRSILRHQRNATVRMGEVVGVDTKARDVLLSDGGRIAYDILVLATGVVYNYFGHDDWREHAASLKTLSDATFIRRLLLLAFERAEAVGDPDQHRRLLTFVVVGGGPTGVELAGSIAELARFSLRRDFRNINPAAAHVILVEAGGRLLAGFADSLSAYAQRALAGLGVDVRLNAEITAIDPAGVQTSAGRIDAAVVLWCAGVKGTPVAEWLGVAPGKHGAVTVAPDLSVPGHPEIFVIGDVAGVHGPDGKPLPQVAPVAKQQGSYVASVIRNRIAGTRPPSPFVYKDPGSLAIIGRSAAVVDFGRLKFTGFIGWLVWGCAHIFFLIGFRSRVAVFLNWLWEWATYARGARLIVGVRRQASEADDKLSPAD